VILASIWRQGCRYFGRFIFFLTVRSDSRQHFVATSFRRMRGHRDCLLGIAIRFNPSRRVSFARGRECQLTSLHVSRKCMWAMWQTIVIGFPVLAKLSQAYDLLDRSKPLGAHAVLIAMSALSKVECYFLRP